jgi:hypothetical protein
MEIYKMMEKIQTETTCDIKHAKELPLSVRISNQWQCLR